MQGIQSIEFCEASVTEALQDYINKHLAPGVAVKVTGWEKTGDAYQLGIEATFEQVTGNIGTAQSSS